MYVCACVCSYCERSELLIWQVHQFGLGCIKNCAHRPIRIPFRDFFVSSRRKSIFGTSLILYSVKDLFVLRIEPIHTAVQRCAIEVGVPLYKGVLVRALNLHGDQKSLARTEERWKIHHSHRVLPIESHRVLPIEGSAEHFRCTYV